MAYQPGREPEELKKYVALLIKELRETYPDGIVDMARWNHERWDRPAGYLVQKLGYPNGRSFLNAYGFDVYEKSVPKQPAAAPRQAHKQPPAPQQVQRRSSRVIEDEEEDEEYTEEEEVQTRGRKKGRGRLFFSILAIIILLALITMVSIMLLKGNGGSGSGFQLHLPTLASATNLGSPVNTGNQAKPASSGIRLSDSVSYDGITVTLRSVTEGKGNQSIQPSDGNVYAYCEIEIENNTPADLSVMSLMNFYGYYDGVSVNYSFNAMNAAPENTSLDGTISSGQKKTGYIAYEVPENWKELKVYFKNSLAGNNEFIFTAKR